MKIIYRDQYGLRVWVHAFLAIISGINAYLGTEKWPVFVWGASSLFWAGLGIREWHRRRSAEKNGLDPAIVRIVEKNDPNS